MTQFYDVTVTLKMNNWCPYIGSYRTKISQTRLKYSYCTNRDLQQVKISYKNSMTWYYIHNDKLAPASAHIVPRYADADQFLFNNYLFLHNLFILNLDHAVIYSTMYFKRLCLLSLKYYVHNVIFCHNFLSAVVSY